jgi:TolA-binding protein
MQQMQMQESKRRFSKEEVKKLLNLSRNDQALAQELHIYEVPSLKVIDPCYM